MKKILVLLLISMTIGAGAQHVSDATIDTYINANIIPNAANAITAAKMNLVLNYLCDSKLNKDSTVAVTVSGDTLFAGSDTLVFGSSVTISGDTIFVTGLSGTDTLVVSGTNYWSLSGDDISNNNSGKVILPKDSTYFSGIPDEAWKVGRMLHVNQYEKIEWVSIIKLYEDTQDSLAEMVTPSPYATWIRGTNNLYPATVGDTVKVYANLKLPTTTSTFGTIYKGNTPWIHNIAGNNFFGLGAGNLTASGVKNTGVGNGSLLSVTDGHHNVAIGDSTLSALTDGLELTAVGFGALQNVTSGIKNTALGYKAAQNISTAGGNTAVGYMALNLNQTAYSNTAIGYMTLSQLTNASGNTAVGSQVFIYADSIGTNVGVGSNIMMNLRGSSCNTAVGAGALRSLLRANDNVAIGTCSQEFNKTGINNIAIGIYSLDSNVTANKNVGIGSFTLLNHLTGDNNIAIGFEASRTSETRDYSIMIGPQAGYYESGTQNIGIGANAIYGNSAGRTTGDYNIGIGGSTLNNLKTGYDNIAIGYSSLYNDTSGYYNIAMGRGTMYTNKTGYGNVGLGYNVLYNNTAGATNVAIGYSAMLSNTTANNNVAIGTFALYSSSVSGGNTAIGNGASRYTITASNVAIGSDALRGSTTAANNTGIRNTAVGVSTAIAHTSADYLVAVGYEAANGLTTGDNNTALGYQSLYSNQTGASNLIYGYRAGWKETGSYKSYWAADSTSWANGMASGSKLLWYADMSNAAKSSHFMNIFAKVAIGAAKDPTAMLEVTGNAIVTGSFKSGTGAVADGDTTPDVTGYNTFIYAGSATGSTTVTDLDNPVVGAYYTFIGNSDSYTLAFGGANFKLAGSSPVLSTDDVITFYCKADNYYIEISRSNNN